MKLHSQIITTHLQWRVWSWLRMNASGRLNTCKSRGISWVAILGYETGKRVRNTYATFPKLVNSPPKGGLIHRQWRVWSWLRMNASGRLNTCKSRGSTGSNTWWRPANGCGTRTQPSFKLGNSPEKVGLIPRNIMKWHHFIIKAPAAWRWACAWLGSWRGNGPPSLRSVTGVRARPVTRALRHGPDSYGRQQ